MAKITKLVGNEYQGKTNYTVTLSDGTTGYLQDKTSDSGLKEGDEVIATVEDYTSKAGKQSKLVSLRRVQGEITPSNASLQQTNTPIQVTKGNTLPIGSKTIAEMKHDSRIAVIEVLGKLASEGKIEPKEMTEFFNQFYPAVDLSYDVIG